MTMSAPNANTNHQDACVQKVIDSLLLNCPLAPRMRSYDAKIS